MPDDTVIDVEVVRAAVGYLRRSGAPIFRLDTYVQPIDPYWLETPARRGALWTMLDFLMQMDHVR